MTKSINEYYNEYEVQARENEAVKNTDAQKTMDALTKERQELYAQVEVAKDYDTKNVLWDAISDNGANMYEALKELNKVKNATKNIKWQIRNAIANHEKIDNLNDVDDNKVEQAYKTKELYNYEIQYEYNPWYEKVSFCFIDKDTGYHYTDISISIDK